MSVAESIVERQGRLHHLHARAVIAVPVGEVLLLRGRHDAFGVLVVGVARSGRRRATTRVLVVIGCLRRIARVGLESGGKVRGRRTTIETVTLGRAERGVAQGVARCINRHRISVARVEIDFVVQMILETVVALLAIDTVRQIVPAHAARIVEDEHDVRLDAVGDSVGQRLVGEVDIGGRHGRRQQGDDGRHQEMAKCSHGLLPNH